MPSIKIKEGGQWVEIVGGSSGGVVGAGITVKDEGSPLQTAATTLNFVGAGVTATGTGAEKTITIDGGSSGATTFLELTDTPGSYTSNKFLAVNSGGTAVEFVDAPSGGSTTIDIEDGGSPVGSANTINFGTNLTASISNGTATITGSSGATDFLDLSDTPASYTNQDGKFVVVSGNSLAFTDAPGGGTLSAVEQTGYNCDNPISISEDGTTIGIGTTSNAYGTRYVEDYLPLPSDGCDGDLWYYTAASGGSSGATTFLELTDTPASYTSNKFLAVNSSGNAVEFVDAPSGGGIGTVDVKQYADENGTEYGCTNPITVSTNAGIATIGIGTTSNAYGTRYIQATEPTGVCDGDIWYDTTPSSGSGAGDVDVGSTGFFINANELTSSKTVSSGYNAGVFGPYTIANGVTLTIDTGATFVVV